MVVEPSVFIAWMLIISFSLLLRFGKTKILKLSSNSRYFNRANYNLTLWFLQMCYQYYLKKYRL
nr:MAG TPA: hypothetical protein [Caudoviricetes sp.]